MFTQLNEKLKLAGLPFTAETLTLDGEKHDLEHDTFKGQYIGSSTAVSTGVVITLTCWDWRGSGTTTFRTESGKLSPKERGEVGEKQVLLAQKMEAEKKSLQQELSVRAEKSWAGYVQLDDTHGYLDRKGLTDLGSVSGGTFLGAKIVRETRSGTGPTLTIPMRDHLGKLWGMQRINERGDKMFMDGQKVEGTFHVMGQLHAGKVLYICEGFATASTLHLCSGKPTAVAFSSRNLCCLGEILRDTYPDLRLVFCGDEDIWKADKQGNLYLTGRRAALTAAQATQGSVLQVSFSNIPDSMYQKQKPTDFNDLHVLSAQTGGENGQGISKGKKEVADQVKAHYETAPLEYIPTEHTGFYEYKEGQRGVVITPKPDHLCLYYERYNVFCVQDPGQRPYVYKDGVWKSLDPLHFLGYAEQHFTSKWGQDRDCDDHTANEVKKKILRRNLRPVEWFQNTTEGKVNFVNGVLDLKTGAFGECSPEYGFRTQMPYEYDASAMCPEWDSMLERVTMGDAGLIASIDEFIGYCFSSDKYWAHKALVLVGEGSNGKSTVLDTVRALLGTENCASLTLSDLSQEYNRAMLDGKLACISEENEQREQDMGANNAFKNLSSGGTIRARSPYEKPYDFTNRAKFLFAFNRFERVSDTSHGMGRRLLIVPFNAVFDVKADGFNRNIKDVLLGELPGIFNRCYLAYKGAVARGSITESEASREAVASLLMESDSVSMYCEDFIEPVDVGQEALVVSSEMYADYANWCKNSGYKAVGISQFTRRVVRNFGEPVKFDRIYRDAVRVRVIRNIKWNEFSNLVH